MDFQISLKNQCSSICCDLQCRWWLPALFLLGLKSKGLETNVHDKNHAIVYELKTKSRKKSHWCNLEEMHFFWRKRLLFLLPLHFLAFLWLVASCPPPLVTSKHHCLGSQDECFLNEPLLVQTRAGYFKNLPFYLLRLFGYWVHIDPYVSKHQQIIICMSK